MKRASLALSLLLVLGACGGGSDPTTAAAATAPAPAAEAVNFAAFAARLDGLRQSLAIPGMAAAVVQDQELVWAEGFGFADLDAEVPVTPNTPFHLASVTKPVAAVLIMQLVTEGAFGLDDPVADYGVELEDDAGVTVRHLLTHTSEGVPGSQHRYNGDRYALLGQVAEAATGTTFRSLMSERIFEPLGMAHTAGNHPGCGEPSLGTERDAVDALVRAEMAKPYQLDMSYDVTDGEYATHYSPAAGLLSSVVDLAAFDIALDRDELLSPEAKQQMFTPQISTMGSRTDTMYGLGWYVQQYDDTGLWWHYGRWPPSVSALYLKVPDENLSFFVLANTPNLSTPFSAGSGDGMYSALALAFYEDFVFPRLHGAEIPAVDWEAPEAELIAELSAVADPAVRDHLQRQLISHRMMLFSVGQYELVAGLQAVHNAVFEGPMPMSDALSSAADQPAPEAVVALSEEELAPFVGRYTFVEVPEDLPGEVPTEIRIEASGSGSLIGCADTDDNTPVVFRPIGPDRFRATNGGGGYIYAQFEIDGERVIGGTVSVAGFELVYERAD